MEPARDINAIEDDPEVRKAIEEAKDREQAVVRKLAAMADTWRARKRPIEERWLADLRQYHGQHDTETQAKIDRLRREQRSVRSDAFVNVTRAKTNAMAARLMDMLFPTDERCWAIEPTPVPDLEDGEEVAAARAAEADREMTAAKMPGPTGDPDPKAIAQAEAAVSEADALWSEIQALQKEARDKARNMEREIDDQLKESRWSAEARDIIEDGCRLGAGVVEGPVVNMKARRGWRQAEGNVYSLTFSEDPRAAARRVDPWAFYPDPDARTLDEGRGAFVLHLETKRSLRRWARIPGVDADAVRRLIEKGPTQQPPSYLTELRQISDRQEAIAEPRYMVWRYVGAIEPEDLRDVAMAKGDTDLVEMATEVDPLDEINIVALFCDGEVLKVDPHPLDSGESPFSIFALERDEASVWGYGIPHIIRSEQRILNAAWRAMMDNAGAFAGPQVVRDTSCQSQDGTNEVRPWQVWNWDSAKARAMGSTAMAPLQFIQADMNQTQLANIITMARQQIDDVTSMPMIQQGEQGDQTTKTVGGMAMLMSSGNVLYRRIVRSWDDDLMTPLIRRFYDWNMQHSPKEGIKGDYEVVARGASVLLVREMQAQNLMFVMANFAEDPDIDMEEVKAAFFRSMLMSADTFMRSPDRKRQWLKEQEAAAGPSEADIKMRELDLRQAEIDKDIAVAEMSMDARHREAELRHETAMMRLAHEGNVSLDQIDAKLRDAREKRDSDERKMAAEIGMRRMTGTSSGGSV